MQWTALESPQTKASSCVPYSVATCLSAHTLVAMSWRTLAGRALSTCISLCITASRIASCAVLPAQFTVYSASAPWPMRLPMKGMARRCAAKDSCAKVDSTLTTSGTNTRRSMSATRLPTSRGESASEGRAGQSDRPSRRSAIILPTHA